MGKNILIVNGHQYLDYSPGKLNKTLVDAAREHLEQKGCTVKITSVEEEFDCSEEVERLLWADMVIFQAPVYWMSIPWKFKQYIDEVYMTGYGRLFKDDGRIDGDPGQKYGSGGLMQGKKYLLSTTWNAPEEAFNDQDQFFDGLDVDGVFVSFHKGQAFLGMEQLPSFSCHDVLKSPAVDAEIERFNRHLDDLYSMI